MASQDHCRDDENGVEKNDKASDELDPFPYSARSTLAQCFATFVVSLSMISVGVLYTVPTVVIASVKDAKNGELFLSPEQISWYASLLPTFQPCGCFFGGWLQNYIGRRQGLLVMNASNVLAWALLYLAINVEMLYMSSVLMGISMGLTEAPSVTYVSEIATPSLRGTLITCTSVNVVFGTMLTFLLTVFMGWRTLSVVCIVYSIFSVLLLLAVPDSPVWLITRERTKDAMKALQWLRGWVPESRYVTAELEELSRFLKKSFSDDPMNTHFDKPSEQRRTFKASYLLEAGTLRPFVFLFCLMSFAYSASTQAARNYYLVIIESLNLPVDGNLLALLNGASSLVGSLTCAATVRIFGKRILSLWSMILSSILSLLLGFYIMFENELQHLPYIFVVLFVAMGFTSFFGICTVPWAMFGEVYPTKTKSVAIGLTGAAYYISFSIYVKTYHYLQLVLTTHGMFILYGVVGFIGFFYLWIRMPETEGKTMAEIEELFEDDARKSCTHFRKKK